MTNSRINIAGPMRRWGEFWERSASSGSLGSDEIRDLAMFVAEVSQIFRKSKTAHEDLDFARSVTLFFASCGNVENSVEFSLIVSRLLLRNGRSPISAIAEQYAFLKGRIGVEYAREYLSCDVRVILEEEGFSDKFIEITKEIYAQDNKS